MYFSQENTVFTFGYKFNPSAGRGTRQLFISVLAYSHVTCVEHVFVS